MRRALLLFALAGCTQYREVNVTFGEGGEGLDGFLCKTTMGSYLLDRGSPPPGKRTVSIVTDVVGLSGGAPGCRTGQLMAWCKKEKVECAPMKDFRVCTTVELPTGFQPTTDRETIRPQVQEALTSKLRNMPLVSDTPNDSVILRMVATSQPCSEVESVDTDFDPNQLIGCVYSCPTLFDRTKEDVYLGFETLTALCDQGVRICASRKLNWQP